MTSTVMLRVIYGVAVAGLLIAGGYLLGFQMLWKQCSPESHWVEYSGEDISTENFFGPGMELLGLPAHDLIQAAIPSLYKSSSESHRRTIRMVSWRSYVHSAGVLMVSENRKGGFEANFTVVRFEWDREKGESVVKITENRSWPFHQFTSKMWRQHLSAENAWQGCKDLDFWGNADHGGVFIIEESRGGRYRMLVQDTEIERAEALQKHTVSDPNGWYLRSYKLYRDTTGGGQTPYL